MTTATPPLGVPDSHALLIRSNEAAALCGRSRATWWRDLAAGRVPSPVRLGFRTFWRVQELRAWIEAGCPSRKVWEARRK